MTDRGRLASGSRFVVEVPERWNGTLLLVSHPVPVGPDEPPWPPEDPLVRHLVAAGYAVAGSANTIFWPLELVFSDIPELLDVATRRLGAPRRTVILGLSIGGIIAAGAVQLFPDRLSGALPIGGNLAGAVANHNRELDMAFVIKTLLAPASPLQIVAIANARENLATAYRVLRRAQSGPEGRARLALAAAVGNVPGWHDPMDPEPGRHEVERRQWNQCKWFEDPGFLVFFLARRQVEIQAGGNPSWNAGVDYRQLLSRSINRDEVEALYESVGLELDADLDRLAVADRIEADSEAVAYLERHIVFNGDLGGVPVLAVHTGGDGLVPADHEHAFADVVRFAEQDHLLRQLYVERGGHCTLTLAEVQVSLDRLLDRIETGAWPPLEPHDLNEDARRLGACNVLVSGQPAGPAFFPFEPSAFLRPYDVRDTPRRAREPI